MKILLLSSEVQMESIEQLSSLGYEIFTLPAHNTLPKAISSHPDSLVFRGRDRIIVDNDYYLENIELFRSIAARRPELRIVTSLDGLGDKYPYDARLNAIVIGNKLFCHLKSISRAITEYAEELGLELVDTKQGYPACSTLKIAENAVICADRGLSSTYRRQGIFVYEIEPGGILLPPYEYGFIGGACAVLGDRVCFFGELSEHPSHEIIGGALKEHSLLPVSIAHSVLKDIGGGILL